MKKKSLVETLKATKKANVITAPAKNEGGTTRKSPARRGVIKKFAHYGG